MGTQAFVVKNSSLSDSGFRELCADLLQYLYEITPKDTGYCSDQLTLSYGAREASFLWDCIYASYLNNGWSSQAPDGMTDPALQWLQDHRPEYT